MPRFGSLTGNWKNSLQGHLVKCKKFKQLKRINASLSRFTLRDVGLMLA